MSASAKEILSHQRRISSDTLNFCLTPKIKLIKLHIEANIQSRKLNESKWDYRRKENWMWLSRREESEWAETREKQSGIGPPQKDRVGRVSKENVRKLVWSQNFITVQLLSSWLTTQSLSSKQRESDYEQSVVRGTWNSTVECWVLFYILP